MAVDGRKTDAGQSGDVPDVGFMKIRIGKNFQNRAFQTHVDLRTKAV
jgi:hypothetical protein